MRRFLCSLPLLATTGLVLALHWAVLQGLPWQQGTATEKAGPVFSTRTIAAPRPIAQTPSAATPTHSVRVPVTAITTPQHRTKAKPKTIAQPLGAHTDDVLALGPPAEVTALPAPTNEAAPETAQLPEPVTEVVPEVVAVSHDPAPPPAPLPARPAGVDITPPGNSTVPHGSTTAPAVRLPAPARLLFDVRGKAKGFDYQADAQLLWQHDGTRYEAHQVISAFLVGKRSQQSVGAITPQGLEPERFADRSRSEQAAHFDHARGRITFSANTPAASTGPGAQDRLSVFIQLAAWLAASPERFTPGTEITVTTVSARSADRWTFRVQEQETLDLPFGTTTAWKLERLPRKEYDQKAELWLAPMLGYLPARIRLTQANGDFADLQLRAHETP